MGKWYREEMGLPLTDSEIMTATSTGVLPSFLLGGAVWYSTQDAHNYVMAQRRSASEGTMRRRGEIARSAGGAA